MAREIDIMNFGGLTRTLVTLCNIASMGKKLEFKNRFINKPLEMGQFFCLFFGVFETWPVFKWGGNYRKKLFTILCIWWPNFSEMGP